MTVRAQLQLLAGLALLGVVIMILAALYLAAGYQETENEFLRLVTQREIDDAVGELIRDARDDFERGGT